MRKTSRTQGLWVLVLGVMVSSLADADQKRKQLNRSIYMPVEFQLCEHLDSAIFYENDLPTSTMPAERIFQFTYYPDLGVVLPEQVPVRVEGTYKEDDELFVAKLAVTVDGIRSARRFRSAGTLEQVETKLHRVDIRLKPKTLKLKCKRYCTKRVTTVAANDP